MSNIDLASLPAPEALEVLSFVELRNAWAAALEDPDLAASLVAGDLVTEIIYIGAYRELYARARINDEIKAAFLATGWGEGLDVTGAQMDVPRGALSDDDYRAAIHAESRTIGTGTRTRYEAEAELAHADILRATARRTADANLQIRFSFKTGADTGAITTAVETRLDGVDDAGFEIRMITDQVVVLAATENSYDITANLHIEPGPAPAEVIGPATERLQAVIDQLLVPGYPVLRSEILSALHGEGIAKVDLTDPAANSPVSPSAFYRLGTLTITSEVAAWLR